MNATTTSDAPARAPRTDKVAVVDEVRQRFDDAEAVLFTEYRGLDVTELATLRGELIGADCRYKIYKNSLVRLAIGSSAPDGALDLLVGPTALAFCGKDPSAAAKALRAFAAGNEALVIKGGVLAGTLLDDKQIRELADLPSRDDVMAQILGAISAPLSSLASMMNNLVSEMAGLVQALADKTPPEAPEASDAPAPPEASDAPAPPEASDAPAPPEASDAPAPPEASDAP